MTTRKYVEYIEQTDRKRYPSDLTAAEWELIEPLVVSSGLRHPLVYCWVGLIAD
jgi:hypothetical protein